jgi:hypothetical protein
MALLGDFGFEKAADTAGFCFDFFGRKNEAGCGGLVRLAQHFVHVLLGYGGVEGGLAGGCAFGFQVFEGLGCVREDAVKALFVHAEVDEGLGMLPICGCRSEDGVNFGMAGVDLSFGAVMAEGEHAVFEAAHAIEAPLGIDYGLRELAFGEGFRR